MKRETLVLDHKDEENKNVVIKVGTEKDLKGGPAPRGSELAIKTRTCFISCLAQVQWMGLKVIYGGGRGEETYRRRTLHYKV